jgi:hypothetical protein
MGLWNWLTRLFGQPSAPAVRAAIPWYRVRFRGTGIDLDVTPPGPPAWAAQIDYKDIRCVCFKTGDGLLSDEVYLFTSHGEESYLIPVDADGGAELMPKLVEQELFPPRPADQGVRHS